MNTQFSFRFGGWIAAFLIFGLAATNGDEKPGSVKKDSKPIVQNDSASKEDAGKKKDAAKKNDAVPQNSAEAVFELHERSVFEITDIEPWQVAVGQFAGCSDKPDKTVKAYPKLHSKRPLYGKVEVGVNPLTRQKGRTLNFVLDESGENPPTDEMAKKQETPRKENAEEKKDDKDQKNNGKNDKVAKKRPRSEDLNKPSRYDRLYIDLNGDLDLTNDAVVKPMKDPPWNRLPSWSTMERMAFDFVEFPIDYGQGIGVRLFRVLPWLTGGDPGGKNEVFSMHFVPAVVRQGEVRFGDRQFIATLAQSRMIAGRFDSGIAELILMPVNASNKYERLQSDGFAGRMLRTAWRVGGQIYLTSTTPLGHKLTVKPYQGDFGVFAVGPGSRKLKGKELSLGGSLSSKDFDIGLADRSGLEKAQDNRREYLVPVGDYVPSYLSIEFGKLQVGVSDNYHSEGAPRSVERRERNYFIHIRKDKPFVLDFRNKPEIIFSRPTKDMTFKPGDEVSVAAVLIDPKLDIMIRRLTDTSRKEKKTIRQGTGKEAHEFTYEQPVSLDPIVTITDSAGKKVSEGPMPFG